MRLWELAYVTGSGFSGRLLRAAAVGLLAGWAVSCDGADEGSGMQAAQPQPFQAPVAGQAAGTQAAPSATAGGPPPSSAGTGGNNPVGPVGGAAGAPASGLDAGGVVDAAGPDSGPEAGTTDAGVPALQDAGNRPVPADDFCDVGLDDGGPAPRPLSLSGNTFAHDPTMIEADGVFYRFWTGDYIPVATSTDLMRWDNAASVYGGRYPQWSTSWLASVPGQTFNFPWAPDVSYFGGRYHLYSSFSARFGRNISCITHLTTTDIASGDWTDHGPVICSDGSERYNAIDAEVGLDEDGTAWLAFGSFWDGIMMFQLDAEGNRVGTELTHLASAPPALREPQIEAPVLFRRCGYHYLLVSWGVCCPGNNRSVADLTYRIAVGRSQSITGPYVDRNGDRLDEGGGTLIVEGDSTFAAAGHSDVLVTDDRIYHLYHAYRYPTGRAELRIVEMRFDADGWPIPAPP